MATDYQGRGYEGGEGTSTANQDILTFPENWTNPKFYEFSFMNDQKCHVQINGSSRQIPIAAGVGFEMNTNDAPIYKFIIVEAGINYEWRAKY